MSQTILVTGATGNQGNAVIEQLLDSDEDFDLLALTRDPSTDRAQALPDEVTVVEGDLYDKDSLIPHLEEADSVFAVTNFWTEGFKGQVQQGKNLADAADEVGIDYFVFSGVANQEDDTGIPHFDAPHIVDLYARKLGLPVITLKPVWFNENLEAFVEDIIGDQTIALPLEEGVELQVTSYEDFAKVVARVFESPDEYLGDAYNIASDELTLEEHAEILSEVTGLDIDAYHVPIDEAREGFGEEFAVMCEWFNEHGYTADIDALEAEFDVEFNDFEDYLRAHGWKGGKEEPAAAAGWVKAMQ